MKVNYNKIWDDKWGDMQKYGPTHRHHRRIAKKMLSGLDYVSVLDVGCGEGSNLAFLNSLKDGLELSGSDVSSDAIDQAKKIVPQAKYYVMDSQKEKIEKQFDLVFCSDVVEHLENDREAIKNMYDMTGKYCLIATVQGRMREFEKGIGHIRNYKYGELKKIMQNAGFIVVQEVSWGWPFYSPIFRDLLDRKGVEKQTGGKYGLFKKIVSNILYFIFLFNSQKKGDVIFVLAKK